MNITTELFELYSTAKAASKLDLAFRILACLAKMKPETVSVDMLSVKDMTSIIAECDVLAPDSAQDNDVEMTRERPSSSPSFSIPPHACPHSSESAAGSTPIEAIAIRHFVSAAAQNNNSVVG